MTQSTAVLKKSVASIPITPADVAGAVRNLGNTFTVMEVYAKMDLSLTCRDDVKAHIDRILNDFVASSFFSRGPHPTAYFMKNNPT